DIGATRTPNAILATGHARPAQAHAPHDHAQRESQQQEVNSTDTGSEQSEDTGSQRRRGNAEETTDPGRPAHDRRPVDHDVSRNAENRTMAQRDAARVA